MFLGDASVEKELLPKSKGERAPARTQDHLGSDGFATNLDFAQDIGRRRCGEPVEMEGKMIIQFVEGSGSPRGEAKDGGATQT